jgi:hypothetical protein
VNKELWSVKAKTGLDYEFAAEFYEDIPYECWACRAPSLFTAEQQKHAFEVKRAYTWQRHVLCQRCFSRRNELTAEAASFARMWVANKAALAADRTQLLRWRELLDQLPRLGMRKDTARTRMLDKLIRGAP